MTEPPDPVQRSANTGQDQAIAYRALVVMAVLSFCLLALIARQLDSLAKEAWQMLELAEGGKDPKTPQIDDSLPYVPAPPIPGEPAILANAAVRPKLVGAAAADLFGTDDYPPDALRREQSGAVVFELRIDPTGLPRRCLIAASSGVASLDAVTCRRALERFRFVPAKDATGRAIWSSFTRRVRWIIPHPDAP